MTQRRLILASTSPRRRLILDEHGFAHTAIDPGIDDAELHHQGVGAREWAVSLAHLKARAGLDLLRPGSDPSDVLVLAGDTVVVKAGQIIGKPEDAEDARRIITLLRSGSHAVVSGVALVWPGGRELFFDEARVTLGHVSDDAIEAYAAGDDWRGKAGAYNLSERIDAGWPITCAGDPTTVMGLPIRRLTPILRRLLGPEPVAR